MAYNNPYQNMSPYQNINPYQPTNPYQQFQRVPAYGGQIVQVNGKAGAESLQMEPNSSIYVQDSTQGNRIFLCMTDGAGYKTVRGIIGVFEEEQEKKQKDDEIALLENRVKVLEDMINGYVASDEKRRKPKPTNGTDKADD